MLVDQHSCSSFVGDACFLSISRAGATIAGLQSVTFADSEFDVVELPKFNSRTTRAGVTRAAVARCAAIRNF